MTKILKHDTKLESFNFFDQEMHDQSTKQLLECLNVKYKVVLEWNNFPKSNSSIY